MELKTYKKILTPQECTLIKIKYVFRQKIKSILQICFYIGRYGQNKKKYLILTIFVMLQMMETLLIFSDQRTACCISCLLYESSIYKKTLFL